MRTIKLLDTTLRDGEQSPGCSMHINEKIAVADALQRLNVDIIEAGYPAASEGDFEAVRQIAKRACLLQKRCLPPRLFQSPLRQVPRL